MKVERWRRRSWWGRKESRKWNYLLESILWIYFFKYFIIYFEEYQNMFNLFSQLQLLSGLWFAYFTIHILRTTHWITLKFWKKKMKTGVIKKKKKIPKRLINLQLSIACNSIMLVRPLHLTVTFPICVINKHFTFKCM